MASRIGMSNAAGGTGMKVQINWRRGPREMKKALKRTRTQFLRKMEREMRRMAPESVRNSISRTASQVVVAHSAARFIESGQKPGSMPPLEPIRKWAESVGKDPRDAFPIARWIKEQGREARPFIKPAIKSALATVDDEFRRIWEGER